MSDVEKLLARFESGALLRPTSDVPNIVDLARALAWLVGTADVELTPVAVELANLIGPCDHLIFILADGLGLNLVEMLPGSSFLVRHLAAELRAVFPSTTAVALTSIATGVWPNRHGVTGQWTHLPEIRNAGALLPFTTRAGGQSLRTLGVTPECAFPLPSLLCGVGRDTLALLPASIAESVYSAYFCGRQPRRGYTLLAEAVDLALERVRSAEAPTYTYIYTPRIDLEAHRSGTRQQGVRAALGELEHEVERLAEGLAGSGRIVLSADHGLLDTPAAATHWMRPSVDLFDVLRVPPSGDARVMYLHVRDGAGERLRRSFRASYGERFFLISVEEAEQLELFGPGPLAPHTRTRLGDLIVVSSGVDMIEYAPTRSTGRLLSQAAHHSGLTPAEMRVPLVLA